MLTNLVFECLQDSDPRVRKSAVLLYRTLAFKQPAFQDFLLREPDVLERFVEMLNEDPSSVQAAVISTLRAVTVLAVRAPLSGAAAGIAPLVAQVLPALPRLLKSTDQQVQNNTAFVCCYLVVGARDKSTQNKVLKSSGSLGAIFKLLNSENKVFAAPAICALTAAMASEPLEAPDELEPGEPVNARFVDACRARLMPDLKDALNDPARRFFALRVLVRGLQSDGEVCRQIFSNENLQFIFEPAMVEGLIKLSNGRNNQAILSARVLLMLSTREGLDLEFPDAFNFEKALAKSRENLAPPPSAAAALKAEKATDAARRPCRLSSNAAAMHGKKRPDPEDIERLKKEERELIERRRRGAEGEEREDAGRGPFDRNGAL